VMTIKSLLSLLKKFLNCQEEVRLIVTSNSRVEPVFPLGGNNYYNITC
jgi:hypothetical protein